MTYRLVGLMMRHIPAVLPRKIKPLPQGELMFDNGKISYKTDIKLGERYLDKQTGIAGVATAISFFQHACERVTIELIAKEELKEYSFDSPRLTHVETGATATSTRTGGPERIHDPRRSQR
jgi:hypothetical protein